MVRRIATLSAVLLALSSGAALAQGGQPMGNMGGMGQGQGPGGFAQRRLQMLLNGITLTPAQQKSVDSIVQATQAQMPAFTPGQAPDPTARETRRTLMMRQDSTIKALLTPDQQQVWDRNVANMPQRRPGM